MWSSAPDDVFVVGAGQVSEGADWVFDHPFFIILNLAVGGNYVGSPNDSTVFPQTLLIDWVRVYSAS